MTPIRAEDLPYNLDMPGALAIVDPARVPQWLLATHEQALRWINELKKGDEHWGVSLGIDPPKPSPRIKFRGRRVRRARRTEKQRSVPSFVEVAYPTMDSIAFPVDPDDEYLREHKEEEFEQYILGQNTPGIYRQFRRRVDRRLGRHINKKRLERRRARFKELADMHRANAENTIVLHQGSPVGWYDLDLGFVRGLTLYDLVVGKYEQGAPFSDRELHAIARDRLGGETRKDVVARMKETVVRQFHGRPVWLLSAAQWDNQQFPPESQGGPPYIEHVSTAHEDREVEDYDSPDDALAGAASRIGAEWYVRRGDSITVFMATRSGYYKAKLFKKGGWYHWPTDWPEHVHRLPDDAEPVPGAPEEDRPEVTRARRAIERARRPRSEQAQRGIERVRHRIGAEEGRYFERSPREDQHYFEAPVREAAEQSKPSAEVAGAVPWVKLERDPKAYAEQMADAQALGKIDTARAVYDMLAPSLAKEDQEVFLVVAVDVRGQCRGVTEVHRGARSRVSVDVPEILRTANALGGEMFVVVHNHPSGHAKPSAADKELTKAIEKAAQASDQVMMDHVVIGLGEYYSFAEGKLEKA